MASSVGTFQTIYDSLRSTMYYKQQLDYERMRVYKVYPVLPILGFFKAASV